MEKPNLLIQNEKKEMLDVLIQKEKNEMLTVLMQKEKKEMLEFLWGYTKLYRKIPWDLYRGMELP